MMVPLSHFSFNEFDFLFAIFFAAPFRYRHRHTRVTNGRANNGPFRMKPINFAYQQWTPTLPANKSNQLSMHIECARVHSLLSSFFRAAVLASRMYRLHCFAYLLLCSFFLLNQQSRARSLHSLLNHWASLQSVVAAATGSIAIESSSSVHSLMISVHKS